MTDPAPCIFSIDSFSPEGTVPGPRALHDRDAVAYLAQRMADQHRGGLTSTYWKAEARRLLEAARESPALSTIRRVERGRGVVVCAQPAGAAVYEVSLYPLYDGDSRGGKAWAVTDHPQLAEAMGEAGLRGERRLHRKSGADDAAGDGRQLVGFHAEIRALLLSPLLAEASNKAGRDVGTGASHAPQRGCGASAR